MGYLILMGVVLLIGFVAFTGAPYVPSKRRDIVRAFSELYAIGPNDVLVDIGSGDGIVLRQASKLGAHAIGYEIHPILVVISRFLSRGDTRVRVVFANFWRKALPLETTVVYTFGDSRDINKMYQKIQHEAMRLNRELVFITYGFDVPSVKPVKQVGAHFLYKVKPLQGTTKPV
ncbi:hypothetical protein EOL96_04935 [Candidatus Saccharibacteria bacterium]|nr:hypothetical protein [Candidatus Saccharibacteria bacterium]